MNTADPILFACMEDMARRLALVRAGADAGAGTAGYYFNWNPTNMFDATLMAPGPNASFYFMGEEPQDEDYGNNGGLYDNVANFKIEVQFIYQVAPENPLWTGQKDAMKCQEDLKRFFEHMRDLFSAVGMFDVWRPKDIKPEIVYSQDRINPVKLVMPWRMAYSQSRKEPELSG